MGAEVDDVVEVNFDNCSNWGLSPDELVGDAYAPTQDLTALEQWRKTGSYDVLIDPLATRW